MAAYIVKTKYIQLRRNRDGYGMILQAINGQGLQPGSKGNLRNRVFFFHNLKDFIPFVN